jgi:hypothetical protein
MEPASNIVAASTILERKLFFIAKLLGFIAKLLEIAAGCAHARAFAAWLRLVFIDPSLSYRSLHYGREMRVTRLKLVVHPEKDVVGVEAPRRGFPGMR